jgi:hypothetical protein
MSTKGRSTREALWNVQFNIARQILPGPVPPFVERGRPRDWLHVDRGGDGGRRKPMDGAVRPEGQAHVRDP